MEAARGKLTAGHVLVGVGAAAVAASIYLLLTRPQVGQSTVGVTPRRTTLQVSASFEDVRTQRHGLRVPEVALEGRGRPT